MMWKTNKNRENIVDKQFNLCEKIDNELIFQSLEVCDKQIEKKFIVGLFLRRCEQKYG